jgi:DNA adenine methylase
MHKHDGPETLHYVDPPYLPETRSVSGKKGKDGIRVYRHELTRAEHAQLLADICLLRGMVILSGYRSSLYDKALRRWQRVETLALADGARQRTEVLWLNPACSAALEEARAQKRFRFSEAAE